MGQQINTRVIEVGDTTPLWSANYTHTEVVNIGNYVGNKAVLLLFYPADWTVVSRDELPLWEELIGMSGGLELQAFGISGDTIECHRAFAHEIGLEHIKLLSDPTNEVAEAYGLLDTVSGLTQQALVLIDPGGIIRQLRIELDANQPRSSLEVEEVLQQAREWSGLTSDLEVWKEERQRAMQLPHPTPLKPPTQLQLRFWGTRGSAPVSGMAYARYGGNTSCISLTSDTGHLFIFDCGSGARELGNFLLSPQWSPNGPDVSAADSKKISGYIFLSHTHLDHIQGFPFFAPIFKPDNRFNIIGWSNPSQTLGSILAGLMEHIYFPVSMEALPSTLSFYSLRHEGQAVLDGAKIDSVQLKHPIPSTAYRLELGGKRIVYATDHEPHRLPPAHHEALLGEGVLDMDLIELAQEADVLIHDAQYSSVELLDKEGWGHSSVEVAVDVAIRARVKRLVLYHHDPGHDDKALDSLLASARQRAIALGSRDLEILSASDGLELKL